MHSDSRGRGLRGRRRDRHAFAKGRRRRIRRLYGHARQGLRPAGEGQLPDIQAERCGRRDRDRRPRGDPREVRHRRSRARARHSRPVGRCVGQHSRRAGHRREERLQAGAGVGHGGEHPRQRGADRGQAGREDRRMGRQVAPGQAAHDDLPRRADSLPRGGADGLRAASGRAAGRLCRAGFQGFPERSGEPRTPGAAVRRAASGGSAAVGRDGPRQVGRREEGGAGRAGQSVRRSRGPAAGSRSGGRIAGGGRGDATGHGPDHAARIHARPERRAAARGGGRGGPLRRVLLRYGDHGLRHLQRPDRRAVAGRRAAQGVVRSLPRGGCGGVRRDRAAAVRGGADRQDRPERQVRPDGAPAAGDRGPRA